MRYAFDDPIFEGLDTSVKADAIESNPNIVNCGIVSSKEVINLDVLVYPTLFDKELNIQNAIGVDVNIEIVDIIGRPIVSSILISELKINTTNWNSGFYFLKVQKENASKIYKIVKSIP